MPGDALRRHRRPAEHTVECSIAVEARTCDRQKTHTYMYLVRAGNMRINVRYVALVNNCK